MTALRAGLVAALTAAAILAAAAAPAGAKLPAAFVGMDSKRTYDYAVGNNWDAMAEELSAQRKLRIEIHRQPFNWDAIEYAPGQYNFDQTDKYMAGMATQGMTVLPILFDAPPWHTAPGEVMEKAIFGRPTSGKPLGKFGAAMVRRYGPQGTFWDGRPEEQRKRSAIRAWQIWNEPNLRYYWSGDPNPRQYVEVLRATARRMRKADPDVEIVTAGVPESTLWRAVPLKRWIKRTYAAGAKKWFDTLAVNAYAATARGVRKKLAGVRRIMNRRRDRKAKMWVTEMGWADSGNEHYLVRGERGQARQIKKCIRMLGEERKRLGIRGFIYYMWQDALPWREGADPGTWGWHTGLRRLDGSRKPAYRAFKRAVANLD